MLTEYLKELSIARGQFEFAVRFLSYCELGLVDPKRFDGEHITKLPNGILKFPTGSFSDQSSIINAASINVVMAFAATALVLDQTFEAFGPAPDPTSSNNITRLRTLVYMVRCAHAHRIADPRWEVRGKYSTKLTVNVGSETIELDFSELNGAGFDIEALGGYVSWFKICDEARVHFHKHFL